MKILDNNVIDITEESKHSKTFSKHKEKKRLKSVNKFHTLMLQLLLVNQLIIYLILFYILSK